MRLIRTLVRGLSNQPGYTVMRMLARFPMLRSIVAWARGRLLGRRSRAFLSECESRMADSQLAPVDRAVAHRMLVDRGAAYGFDLPPAVVQEILRFAEGATAYADREPAHGFAPGQRERAEAALGKPVLVAQYFNAERDCPAIARLACDPLLLAVAADYLGSVPVFVGANLWWTYPVAATAEDRDRHAHLFHRDVDDFRFLKFFFYLTDVATGEGAHVLVEGSHRRPPVTRWSDRWLLRRYGDDEIASAYAAGDIREITGPAGTGFAENTLCVHKGRTPTARPRLLLQLQFALFDYGTMHDRRAPAELALLP